MAQPLRLGRAAALLASLKPPAGLQWPASAGLCWFARLTLVDPTRGVLLGGPSILSSGEKPWPTSRSEFLLP